MVAVEVVDTEHARFVLQPGSEVAVRVAGLMHREAQCCSFFEFTLEVRQAVTVLVVRAPGHPEVVTAMAAAVHDSGTSAR